MSTKKPKELTGRHVLMMLFAFFGVMLAVNIYFTIAAVKTFRGEDVPRSYRQGLEYNKTIAARAVQNEMGWTAKVNYAQNEITVIVQDPLGNTIRGLVLEGTLRHPIDTDLDRRIDFQEQSGGRYKADANNLSGKWQLIVESQEPSRPFKFEYELWE